MRQTSTPSKTPRKTKGRQNTLGPITNLEDHLPSDWWQTLFNSLYLKTDGDVVENDANTCFEVDTLTSLVSFGKQDRICDLCCGQGRHVFELARRGFTDLYGVDRSRYLVRLARKRAQQMDAKIVFHEGDARKVRRYTNYFDKVMILGNSFGYFEQRHDDLSVLANVSRMLKEDGFLVLDLVDGAWMSQHFEPRSWEWIDELHFVCRERSLSKDGTRIISREVITHSEKGVIADQFYAERLYGRQEIVEVLRQLGFREVAISDPISSLSTRDQDLGMMARRMMVTAKCPIKTVSAGNRKKVKTKVVVLLGDPRQKDPIKRNGQFNDQDQETVEILKRNLEQLSDYTFDYWDNHINLIQDLEKNPASLILNFCDEGFNNDPLKELHVPGLLELLNIPYTGAGPACLAHCYDKGLVSALAQAVDIPVPLETFVVAGSDMATLPSTFPALIKPNQGDSSFGITKHAHVRNAEELWLYYSWICQALGPRSMLIQEFLEGPEYSVGIIGNPGLSINILPVLEVDYSQLDKELSPILGYESKWVPDSPYWRHIQYREATLDEVKTRSLADMATRLFTRLGCRDYARFDFREDAHGVIKLLEVNPNPGWCWDGKLNLMAGWAGWSYADLLEKIIAAARERLRI